MSLKYKKKEKKLNEIKYSNRKPDPCVLSLSLSIPFFFCCISFRFGQKQVKFNLILI